MCCFFRCCKPTPRPTPFFDLRTDLASVEERLIAHENGKNELSAQEYLILCQFRNAIIDSHAKERVNVSNKSETIFNKSGMERQTL